MNEREIKRKEMQDHLDAQKTQKDRNVMGQFSTPFPLALDMMTYMLPIEFSKYIQLIKFKMTHKVNLQLSEFSKTRGSPRNPCHG